MNTSDYGKNWTLWDPLFQKYCPTLFKLSKTICMIESSLGRDPRVALGISCPKDILGSASQDGKSWGLMQMRLETAQDYDSKASAELLNNPEYAVRIAGNHLLRLSTRLGEPEWVVKAWNQGASATLQEKNGIIPGNASSYWLKYQEHRAIV